MICELLKACTHSTKTIQKQNCCDQCCPALVQERITVCRTVRLLFLPFESGKIETSCDRTMLQPGFTYVDSVIKSSDVHSHPFKKPFVFSRQNTFNSWKQRTCTPHLTRSSQSDCSLAKNFGFFFADMFASAARTPTLYVAMVMLSMLPCAGARVLLLMMPCCPALAQGQRHVVLNSMLPKCSALHAGSVMASLAA